MLLLTVHCLVSTQIPSQCAKTLIQQEDYLRRIPQLINFNIVWCCVICYKHKHKIHPILRALQHKPSHFDTCTSFFFVFDFIYFSVYSQKRSRNIYRLPTITAGSKLYSCAVHWLHSNGKQQQQRQQCRYINCWQFCRLCAGSQVIRCILVLIQATKRKDRLKKLLNRQSA